MAFVICRPREWFCREWLVREQPVIWGRRDMAILYPTRGHAEHMIRRLRIDAKPIDAALNISR